MADKIRVGTVMRWLVITAVCSVLLQCAVPYRMDRPWDPDITQGETLFDQLPNWDQEAVRLRQRGQ